jgi:hypothetical protein
MLFAEPSCRIAPSRRCVEYCPRRTRAFIHGFMMFAFASHVVGTTARLVGAAGGGMLGAA